MRDVHVGLRGRGFRRKFEAQLEAEVKELLARAEAAHKEPLPEGLSIPAELARREERLAAIDRAKAQIEARAAESDAQEQADFDAKMKAREDRVARTVRSGAGLALASSFLATLRLARYI